MECLYSPLDELGLGIVTDMALGRRLEGKLTIWGCPRLREEALDAERLPVMKSVSLRIVVLAGPFSGVAALSSSKQEWNCSFGVEKG